VETAWAAALIAPALGMDNLATTMAIGLGAKGRMTSAIRLRVALVFGGFSLAGPLIGLLLGQQVSNGAGAAGHLVGGVLLVAIGTQTLFRSHSAHFAPQPGIGRLVTAGFAVNVDSIAAGFALGISGASLFLAAGAIGVITAGMSLVGLEIGGHLRSMLQHKTARWSGLVLMTVGLLLVAGRLGR